MLYPIYVLEGPDGAGKTTLAEEFVRRCGIGTILHCGNRFHDRMHWYHTVMFQKALKAAESGPVIIDRWWPSEIAYSAAFRGGTRYPEIGRMMDRLARFTRVTYVWCVPNDRPRYIDDFAALRQKRPEDFDSMHDVLDQYDEIFDSYFTDGSGNVQAERVLWYDRYIDGMDMDSFLSLMMSTGQSMIDVRREDGSVNGDWVDCRPNPDMSGHVYSDALVMLPYCGLKRPMYPGHDIGDERAVGWSRSIGSMEDSLRARGGFIGPSLCTPRNMPRALDVFDPHFVVRVDEARSQSVVPDGDWIVVDTTSQELEGALLSCIH